MRRPFTSLVTTVLCVAFAFAGFRNLPRLEQPASAAAGLAIAFACWVCFRSGQRQARESAKTAAIAAAEAAALAAATSEASSSSTAGASASVNLLVLGDRSRGARAAGQATGLDEMPWIAGDLGRMDELAQQEEVVENMIAETSPEEAQ